MHANPTLALTSTYHACNQVAGILRGHLTAALKLLSADKPSATGIHGARQELKRARATLRLLRRAIAPEHFRQEDTALRQAARLLNDVRDSEILYHRFVRLRNAVRDVAPQANLEPLRKMLLQERRSAASDAFRQRLPTVRTLLTQSRERSRDWRVANDLDLLASGMRRTYRKGRACYRAARESQSDEQLHAWRRQVKHSAYQLEAVGSLAPARMARRLRRSAKLAKALGKDHDLALLQQRVSDAPLDAASGMHLAEVITQQRRKLQRSALALGDRLYRDKPRKFRPLS